MRHLPGPLQFALPALRPLFQSAEMGAMPTLRAATDPGVLGAEYYGPDAGGIRRPRQAGPVERSVARRRAAAPSVGVSEELTGVVFPETDRQRRPSFVLSGRMRLYDDRDWMDGNPNDFLFVPPGGVHGFRNEADEPASVLCCLLPARHASITSRASPSSPTSPTTSAVDWFIANDDHFVE